jgi:hypothetical protein
LSDLWTYSANRIPEISDSVVEIDRVGNLSFGLAENMTPQFERLQCRKLHGYDRSAIPATRSMDAVVQSPIKAVEELLNIQPVGALAESRECNLPYIRDAISIGTRARSSAAGRVRSAPKER